MCQASTCSSSALSTLCEASSAVAVLDGPDDAWSLGLAEAFTACAPPVPTSAVEQSDAGFINPTTGYPSPTGATLCVAGGSYYQRVIGWLEQAGLTVVVDVSTGAEYRYLRRDGGVIATGPSTTLSEFHDLGIIQVVHTPEGVRVVNAAGFFAAGTAAAVWYFSNVLFPTITSRSDAWYVVEWTDTDGDALPGAADDWALVAQGVD